MRYTLWLLLVSLVLPGNAPAAETEPPLANAFRSIFSPLQAPEKKSMGLLQRNFLDLVEESREKLQVALVIDGTDSMAADMAGVRDSMNAMITDLRRYKGNLVEFSVVVYRDSGAQSGEVSFLLNQFSADEAALAAAIAGLQPESGAPYFPELPDLGVHEAIAKLPWDQDESTTKWIILVGDAPPYDDGYTENDTGARRRYATDLLVNAARRQNIAINCILCTSDSGQNAAYQSSLPSTRRFMSLLSSQTGGLMLDLSYPDIRQALIEANLREPPQVTEIGKITPDDVTAAQQAPPSLSQALDLRDGRRVSIAVLPPTSLAKMSFEPEQAPVQMAAELRLKLREIPQVEVRSPLDVERHARRLQQQNLNEAQFVQALAVRLRVDYVMWGDLRREGPDLQLTSAFYSRQNGERLAEATQLVSAGSLTAQGGTPPETALAGEATKKLLLTTVSNTTNASAPSAMNASFRSFTQDPAAMQALGAPIAGKPDVRSHLLHGLDALEKAAAFQAGDQQAVALLKEAAAELEKVVAEEARNAFAQILLANCYYNQAQAALKQGNEQAGNEAMKLYGQALRRAYANRAEVNSDSLRAEIEADYALLIKEDPAEAIAAYTKLAAGDTTRSAALRANWMLAGIYSGDWNVKPEYVDTGKARNHLIQILAHWPESPEAEFIRKSLRWDPAQGNKFQFMPKTNSDLLTAMK